MMKQIWATPVILWLTILSVNAQLPSGSIAPDFTVLDINGQQHHLYDVLEDDKIVLIEFSATWCPPCWAYHQSHALQDFYAEHGPSGDNTARVYWVEGDPATNVNCIYGSAGCNGYSYGNYAAGTEYPIINNAALANAYQVSYYPTIFAICPNKRLQELDPVSAEEIWERVQACPVAYGVNNAGVFEHDPGYDLPEICGTVDLAPSFLLTNLGSAPLTSANILLKWNNNTIESIDWTGYLDTYGESPIQFNSFPVDHDGTMNVVISSINNNAGDEDFSNNYKNSFFTTAKHFETQKVVLKIRTDNYGKETFWELRDDTGKVLEYGGNSLVGPDGGGAFPLGVDAGPGAYPSNTLIKDTLDLPAGGCYSIHFVDAYGDGMCCNYGNGYYKMYNIDNPANPIIVSGEFEAYDRHAFSVGLQSSALHDITKSAAQIEIYPNPAYDLLNIALESDKAQVVNVRLLNSIGQTKQLITNHPLAAGDNSIGISVANLPDGVYLVEIKLGNQFIPQMRRVLVQH
ncbi:MAG: T9SS type A sorting domain-containing protein [Saprospiraceae bacterium]